MQVFSDHTGKTSQARVSALVGLAIAGGLAFTQPGIDWEVLALFVGGPGGFALWQKAVAPMERRREDG